MRTTDERIHEIKEREQRLRAQRRRRSHQGWAVLSVAVFIMLGIALSQLQTGLQPADALQIKAVFYGTALANHPTAGFAIVVLLAFALGICVTMFCYKLKERDDHEQ